MKKANTRVLRNASCVAKQRRLEQLYTGEAPGEWLRLCDTGSSPMVAEHCARTMETVRQVLETVDETLCDHALCQHPLCWETMRRLERGLPRTKLKTVHKIPSENEGELPSLTILELPQWSADQSISNEVITSQRTSVSSRPCSAGRPGNRQTISPRGSSLRGRLDFLRFTRNRSFSPRTRGRAASLKKIGIVELKQHPSSCDQYLGSTMLIWVPNPQNKRNWQKKHAQSITATRSITVKEISFQGQPYDQLAGLSVEQKQKQEMKKKSKNKVPTGEQPYTFVAKQQHLKWWKDTTQPMGKELEDQLPEMEKGLLAQLNQSDHAAEQDLRQQHALAKSQPSFSGYEYQGSRRIPSDFMIAPVNRKVTLHNFTERQQRARSTACYSGPYRMDEKYLEAIDQETLKKQKCIDNNLSASQDNTFTDQGSMHLPSPNSSVEREADPSGSKFLVFSPLRSVGCDYVQNAAVMQLQDVNSEVKDGPSPAVDNRLLTAAETGAGMSSRPNVSAQPGDEVQNAKLREEHNPSTATEMGPPIVEQTHSEGQNSLPITKRGEQEDLSTTTEMGQPIVEQTHSEGQDSLPIAERNEQQDSGAATENAAVTLEQRNRERSEDHQNGTVIAKSVEEQDTRAPTETASAHVGAMDQGAPEI